MAVDSPREELPCLLNLYIPLPTLRLASSALRALEVDKELSPLVQRSLSLVNSADVPLGSSGETKPGADMPKTVLQIEYRATTVRMLRVAVNGLMESLGVVLAVMQELDVDSSDTRPSSIEGA